MLNSFHSTAVLCVALGALVLLSAWLPLVVRKLPLSLPIVAVAIGFLAFQNAWVEKTANALLPNASFEHLTEFVILVALMGAGLRIDL